jgi:hypothetical protein
MRLEGRSTGYAGSMEARSRRRRALAAWAIGAVLATFAMLPLCDLSFDCGCRLPGLGGYAHCDIHTAGPPDCPWCEQPLLFIAAVLVSYGTALLGVLWLPARTRFGWLVLTGLTVAWLTTLLGGIVTSLFLDRPVLAGF